MLRWARWDHASEIRLQHGLREFSQSSACHWGPHDFRIMQPGPRQNPERCSRLGCLVEVSSADVDKEEFVKIHLTAR